MKGIFVVATLLLLCTAAVYAVETEVDVEVSSEIQTTLESMATVSDSHAILQSMQAEANAGGVQRLVELITKVLRRLQRQTKRRVMRHKRHMRGCKLTITRDKAIIKKVRGDRKTKLVKLGIAKNTIDSSKHESARLLRKSADHAQAAAKLDNQQATRKNEYEITVARLKQNNLELEALIKLLKRINAKLTRNGLAEIEAELSGASSAAHAEMIEMIAERVKAKKAKGQANDVTDVHDMIELLIKQLQAEMKGNSENVIAQGKTFEALRKSLIAQADAERKNAKIAVQQRDAAIKAGDAAAKLKLQLEAELKAAKKNIRATKKHLKATKLRCRNERKVYKKKMAGAKKQIRVLKSILKTLKNHKLSSRVVGMLKGVNLSLPVWKKGAWSACSKSCGVGKQTRSVSCSGARCLGNKPRTARMCNKGPCKGDCILSAWSAWSKCSAKCNGGMKKRTRKVLAVAVNGGKKCPSAVGLVQKRACNKQSCDAKKRVAKKQRRNGKKGVRKAGNKKRRALKKKLVKKLKALGKKLRGMKKKSKALRKLIKGLGKQIKGLKSRAEFLELQKKIKKAFRARGRLLKRIGKANVKKFTLKQKAWGLSKRGRKAAKFCASKAKKGSNAFKGCMHDMRLTRGDRKVAGKAAVQSKKVAAKAKRANRKAKAAIRRGGNAPSRTCTSNGDPHTTNFNGDYFHIQVNGIYIFARSDDGFFEVQGKQDGSSGAGSPSYIRSCKIRYDGQVYSDVFSRDGFNVNCRGSQLTITVPGAYQNHMEGVCGVNAVSRGAHNFILKGGRSAPVNYGARSWESGGYGGRNTPLSQWGLSWRPRVENCMYSQAECQQNIVDGPDCDYNCMRARLQRSRWSRRRRG